MKFQRDRIVRVAGWFAPVAMLLGLSVGVSGCGQQPEADDGELHVVASIAPLASLCEQVVGEAGRVTVLLPPGATPHGFEVRPDRMRELARADVLVVVGLGLDRWAEQAAAATGRRVEVLHMAELVGIEADHDHHDDHDHDHGHANDHAHDHDHAHEDEADAHDHHDHGHDADHADDTDPDHRGHDHGPIDPHLWLDPELARKFVLALPEHLAEHAPDSPDALRARASRVADSIGVIQDEYGPKLAALSNKRLVTFHNAFDRLAERFGLEVVAHLAEVELAPGGEVPPRRLADVTARVREHGLKVLYAEPQFPDAAVTAIASETGVRVLRLDPLGDLGDSYEEPGYQQMLRRNLQTLLEGQSLGE